MRLPACTYSLIGVIVGRRLLTAKSAIGLACAEVRESQHVMSASGVSWAISANARSNALASRTSRGYSCTPIAKAAALTSLRQRALPGFVGFQRIARRESLGT